MRLRVGIAVADGGHGHQHQPHAVLHVLQVLAGLLGNGRLEHPHLVAEDERGHQQRQHQDRVRLLLHDALGGEGGTGRTPVDLTHPRGSRRLERGQQQQQADHQVEPEETHTQQEVVDEVKHGRVELFVVLLVLPVLQAWVRTQQAQCRFG